MTTSTTVLAASTGPTVYGQGVTFTATVSAPVNSGGPTGTVTFTDGATVLGTGTVDNAGVATLTTTAVAVGTRSITATYGGDGNHAGSASAAVTQTVGQAAAAVTLAAPIATVFGQPTGVTATVAAATPGSGTATGSVAFYEGATLLQTVVLDNAGHATLTTAGLAVGSHAITAQYGGDANVLAGTSATATQVVGQGTVTGTVTASSATSAVGVSVPITATFTAVAPAAGLPTGTVTFYDGSTVLGTGTLNGSGVATFAAGSLAVGTHAITATFAGDTNFATATTASLSHDVTATTSSTVVTAASGPAVWGQPVTFIAVVAGPTGSGNAGGVVTFTDGSTVLGQGDVNSNGVATLTTANVAVGTRSITATYGGDTNHAGSTSAGATQIVAKAATAVTVSATPPTYAGVTTLTATVSVAAPGAGGPTGTIRFYDGTTLLGSADAAPTAVPTLTVSGLTSGDTRSRPFTPATTTSRSPRRRPPRRTCRCRARCSSRPPPRRCPSRPAWPC